ncbi:hypothetical protein DIPPA_12965 [Diplonema papillatum]|nr:hypothetical protein DIPPA_12965 [Diplonema papillatum]
MPGTKFRLMIDNQAVVFALRKGHRKNYLTNEILCLLFDLVAAGSLQLEPVWVSTEIYKADPFTRGWFHGSPLMEKSLLGAVLMSRRMRSLMGTTYGTGVSR